MGYFRGDLPTLPSKVLDILEVQEENKQEIYSLYESILQMMQIQEIGEKRNIKDFSKVAGLEVTESQAANLLALSHIDFEKITQKSENDEEKADQSKSFEEIMYLFKNEGSTLKGFLKKLSDLGQKINLVPLLSDEEEPKKGRKINFPFNLFSKKSTDEAVSSPKVVV